MKSKKSKLCLLMLVMLLGAVEVSNNSVFAKGVNENAAPQVSQEDVKANKEALEKAEQAIANKDFQSAIVYLTAYINSKPKKYEAYKLRGDAFYALHQFRLAENDYQKAIVLKADDDKFVTGTKVLSAVVLGADKQSQYQNPELGNLYGRLMYAQKALNNPSYEATYEKAFQYNSHIYLPKPKKEDISKINCPQKYGKLLNPQGVDEYIADAISQIEEGQYHEAVFKAQYITSNYPKYYFGHYLLGVALSGMEQYDNAIHSFETALKLNPYDFETYASLGQLFYRKAEKTFSKDDATKSIEYFNNAIKYNPNCNIYHYYIGLNQMIIGDYNLAISSFNSATKLKPNDYNSMYYKLVAQHIKGDYFSVIDGTTSLLYRHVSNYNSVLYLRALAYHKLDKSELALADLDKIHNNMNDIYNEDVRPLSKKEQTLSNYLYYLKAQILQDLGSGVKADLEKAYKNPVIAELADGKISPNFVLTPKQVETEYDYIRTTFTDLNVGFEYQNPNYKIVALTPVAEQNVAVADVTGLKLSTDPVDTLSSGQTSIAQMLATQSFGAVQNPQTPIKYEQLVEDVNKQVVEQAQKVEEVEEIAKEVSTQIEETVVEKEAEVQEVVEEQVEQNVEQVAEGVTEVIEESAEETTAVVEEVAERVNEVLDDKAQEVEEVQEEIVETVAEEVNEVAEEVNKVAEEIAEETVETITPEKVAEEIVETVTPAEVAKAPQAVVEKHANVDLSQFNTVHTRKVLVLKEDDEIIEFEPTSLAEKVEKSKPKVITPITSNETNKIAEEIVKNQQLAVNTVQEEVAKVDAIVDEVKATPVDVNITQSEATTKISEVPAVVIPPVEVKLPAKEVVDEPDEVDEDLGSLPAEPVIDEQVQKEVDISADKALEDILEAEKNAANQKTLDELKQEKPKKSWFGWFKRNKKDNSIGLDEVSDDIVEQTTTIDDIVSDEMDEAVNSEDAKPEDVVAPKVEEPVVEVKETVVKEEAPVVNEPKKEVVKEEIKEDVKTEEVKNEVTEPIVQDSDIPLIRATKAEIEEVQEEVEVKEEKKKFTWWWQKNRDKCKEDKTQEVETEILPEEKVKNKKINWKKFFTPEPKSEIKEVEPQDAELDKETAKEEQVSE